MVGTYKRIHVYMTFKWMSCDMQQLNWCAKIPDVTRLSPFYDKEICSVNRNNAPRDPCSCIEAYVHGDIRIFKREIGAS